MVALSGFGEEQWRMWENKINFKEIVRKLKEKIKKRKKLVKKNYF